MGLHFADTRSLRFLRYFMLFMNYNSSMLYETHVPRYGYKKVWPTSFKCPVCELNGIVRSNSHKPLYIPKKGLQGGERCVYYVCHTCHVRYRNSNYLTLKDLKDYHQCHLEFENHLNTLNRAAP